MHIRINGILANIHDVQMLDVATIMSVDYIDSPGVRYGKICSRYNVPKDMFRFDRLPEGFSTMDARSVRNELSKIRDVANEISSDMAKVLDKSMKPKERRDEAR